MAEYYPLLSRAVAGLRHAPPEQRHAIYERARNALLGQLRSMQPAVPAEAIDRESSALDAAIARVESEIPGNGPGPVPVPAPAAPEVGPGPVAEAPPPTAAPAVAVPPAGPSVVLATPEPAQTVEAETKTAAPAATVRPRVPGPLPTPVRPLAAPPRSTIARPAAEALTRIIADRGPVAPALRATRDEDEVAPAATIRISSALPSAPRLQVPSFADAVADAATAARDVDAPAAVPDPAPTKDEAIRPAAPRPVARERFNPRVIILVGIGALVVLGIAYTAWRLRDKPEALARSRAALAAAEQADRQQQGKVSNRADGGGAAPTPAVPDAPAAVAPSSTDAAGATAPPHATPVPETTAPAPSPATAPPASEGASTAAAAADPATAVTQTQSPAIPVAQRAAFLIDAPDEPQKIKTYVGTVVWRSESVSPGQGQPLATTVRADIDVPDAGLKLTMTFQKNFEAQFPASHTLDLRFTPAANNPTGNVKQINVPQMRKDDSPSGDPLTGLPVTITENYFLVGLSRGDAVSRNIDLIKTRNWFDIPMLMTSGKVAKITFEKGEAGLQVINRALQSWQ